MKRKRLIYGWLDRGCYRISQYPPDAPVRPSIAIEQLSDVVALGQRKRATIFWSPPLPNDRAREFEQLNNGRNPSDLGRVLV